jgi:hypothetical protein
MNSAMLYHHFRYIGVLTALTDWMITQATKKISNDLEALMG